MGMLMRRHHENRKVTTKQDLKQPVKKAPAKKKTPAKPKAKAKATK